MLTDKIPREAKHHGKWQLGKYFQTPHKHIW